MEYEITKDGSYTVIQLKGDVDLFNSPHSRQVILTCVEGKNNVLVDLAGVDYIDSSGVASLVEGYQIAKRNQTGFALVKVSDAALYVLQLANLDKVFPIYSSLEDAMKSGV